MLFAFVLLAKELRKIANFFHEFFLAYVGLYTVIFCFNILCLYLSHELLISYALSHATKTKVKKEGKPISVILFLGNYILKYLF